MLTGEQGKNRIPFWKKISLVAAKKNIESMPDRDPKQSQNQNSHFLDKLSTRSNEKKGRKLKLKRSSSSKNLSQKSLSEFESSHQDFIQNNSTLSDKKESDSIIKCSAVQQFPTQYLAIDANARQSQLLGKKSKVSVRYFSSAKPGKLISFEMDPEKKSGGKDNPNENNISQIWPDERDDFDNCGNGADHEVYRFDEASGLNEVANYLDQETQQANATSQRSYNVLQESTVQEKMDFTEMSIQEIRRKVQQSLGSHQNSESLSSNTPKDKDQPQHYLVREHGPFRLSISQQIDQVLHPDTSFVNSKQQLRETHSLVLMLSQQNEHLIKNLRDNESSFNARVLSLEGHLEQIRKQYEFVEEELFQARKYIAEQEHQKQHKQNYNRLLQMEQENQHLLEFNFDLQQKICQLETDNSQLNQIVAELQEQSLGSHQQWPGSKCIQPSAGQESQSKGRTRNQTESKRENSQNKQSMKLAQDRIKQLEVGNEHLWKQFSLKQRQLQDQVMSLSAQNSHLLAEMLKHKGTPLANQCCFQGIKNQINRFQKRDRTESSLENQLYFPSSHYYQKVITRQIACSPKIQRIKRSLERQRTKSLRKKTNFQRLYPFSYKRKSHRKDRFLSNSVRKSHRNSLITEKLTRNSIDRNKELKLMSIDQKLFELRCEIQRSIDPLKP